MLEVKEFAWADMSPHILQYNKFNSMPDNSDLIRKITHVQRQFDETSRLYKLFHIACLYFQQHDLEYGGSVLLQTGKDCEWLFESIQRPRSYPLLASEADVPGWRRASQSKCLVIDLEQLPWNDPGYFYSESGVGATLRTRHYYGNRILAATIVVVSIITFSCKYFAGTDTH